MPEPMGLDILSASGDFDDRWLSDGPKAVVPVPAGSVVDDALVRRALDGCRAAGAGDVLVAAGGAWLPVAAADLAGLAPSVVLAAPDGQGAVLFARPGFALVAGTRRFLAGAVPEGVDGGRARFARYALRAAGRWPELPALAGSLPPPHTAWARAEDVPSGTGTARQLELVRDFVTGSVGGTDFARGWLAAHRASRDDGERLRDPLLTALDQVFLLLEDYSIEPEFREPDDLTDQELRNAVRAVVLERGEAF